MQNKSIIRHHGLVLILVLGILFTASIVSAADPVQHPALPTPENSVQSVALFNTAESPLSGRLAFSASPDREHDLSRITNDTKGIPAGGNKPGSFAEIDENLSPAEAAALRSLIQNTLHAFAYDAATGAWNARNAENRITFMYTRDGTAEFSGGENAFGLTLLGIGREGEISPAGKAAVRADGRQLNITRQEYTEWYRNDNTGVEQGLTITSRPAGNGPLQVRFRLNGDKLFSLRDNRTLTLTTASGAPLLDYTGLHAYSSDGRELPALLATDGTTLTWEVDDTGAAYPVTIDPVITSASSATAKFTGGKDSDSFGWSVSLSPDGSRALVGAYNNNTAGAAYIFDKPAGGWSGTTSASAATARFTGGNDGDQFGFSTSLSSDGSRALVGAIYNDTAGTDAGAAYIFDKPGGGWGGTTSASAATARFTGGNASDRFGTSLFLSSDGSTALVGAYNNNTAGTNAGAVYIFDKPGGGWSGTTPASSATARFTGGNDGDQFGFSTSLSSDGSRALVGAQYNDTAGPDAGAAYIFDKPGGWSGTTSASSATARFTGGNDSDHFGISASLSSDGSRALVGANNNQTPEKDAGAAYIFDKPAGGWSGTTSASSATARFTGAAGEFFGRSVSLSQDGLRALVGVSAGNHAGAAYLFDKPGGGWSGTTSNSSATAIFKGGANNDGFSYSESLSSDGSWAFVGAYSNNTAYTDAGTAYLFQLPSSFGSIQPASGSIYGGTPVTITGTNFVTGNLLDVTIGGAHATGIAVNSLTRITATTPASATTGATWVNITNGDGRMINTTGAYTYTVPTPTITPTPTPTSSADGDGSDSPSMSGTSSVIATSPGVSKGQTMSFTFSSSDDLAEPLQITHVNATSSQSIGGTTFLLTTVSLGKANQITGTAAVVGYREIKPLGINPNVFSSGEISFRVTDTWMNEHQINPAQLAMFRNHDGVWSRLPTSYLGPSGNFYTYKATTPGFSYFVVAVRNETSVTDSPVATVAAESTVTERLPTTPITTIPTTAPVPTKTTAVPAVVSVPSGSSDIPLGFAVIGVVAIILVIGGILFARRWWIRRQNPALFRDYK